MRRVILGGLIGIITLLLGQAHTAYAHERWFVDFGSHSGEGFSLDLTIGLILGATVLLVVLAFVIERMGRSEKWHLRAEKTQRFLPRGAEWRVLAVLVGVMLIANALMGVFLAPNLIPEDSGLAILSRIVQIVIGVLLLSQIVFSLAGVLVLAALPLATLFFPLNLLIDYVFEFASLGLTFIFVGISSCPDQLLCRFSKGDSERYSDLALISARVGTGLTFVALALHNKLLNPDMAMTFLDDYPLNFMPLLGFDNFSNLHFIFAAGVVELAVGLLLIVGIATRFVAAIVTGLLFTTLIILGPAELIGHMPIMGLALLFLFRGAGPYRLVLSGWKEF
ncbi:MAG: DoxX family membrane protein [Chloroflexi bacterium]|nr:DoxX family membrane protein [Chloroflexota bacterium]